MKLDRRSFLRAAAGAVLLPVAGFGQRENVLDRCPWSMSHFTRVKGFDDRIVLRIGPEFGPAVVLLHELPGLSPADLALAKCIMKKNFTVYLPVLFGEPGQDRPAVGYFQSCAFGEFDCSTLSTRSPILNWLEKVCQRVSELSEGPIGVIGMCLTGAFPLALLRDGVEAAVLCQPTLPFDSIFRRAIGRQKSDIGIDERDRELATQSHVPLLAMRYKNDARCPDERIRTFQSLFQERFALIELEGDGHSTLAGNFDRGAFADTIQYLKVRLRVESGPKRMRLARLGGKECKLGPDGMWTVL